MPRRDGVANSSNGSKSIGESDDWHGDDWQQRCRDDFPRTACALCALAREDIWPDARWRDALYAWSEEKLRRRSWRYMAAVLLNAPEKTLQALTHGVSLWLRSIAATFEGQEDEFLTLCRRVLAQVEDDDEVIHEATEHAINHPVGHVAEALLGWWNRRELKDDQGLPEEIKPIFTELCDTQIRRFRAGRTCWQVKQSPFSESTRSGQGDTWFLCSTGIVPRTKQARRGKDFFGHRDCTVR